MITIMPMCIIGVALHFQNISTSAVNNNRNKLAKERESADDIIHRNEHGLVCRT